MLRIMNRFGKPALALGVALLLLQGADGQQPPDRKGKEPPRQEEPKPSPEVQAWVKTLTEKMNDRNDTIRESARAGLMAIGRPALPSLRKIAEGDDAAAADTARKLVGNIEGNQRGPSDRPNDPFRGRPGDQGGSGRGPFGPGGTGRGPFGPGGPGGPGNFGPGAPGGSTGFDQVLKELKLDDKQKTKMSEISETQQKKWRELQDKVRDGKVEREAMREEMEKLQDSFMKDVKSVLTKEQFEKFEKAMKEGPRGPGGPGGGRPERREN